MINLYNYILHRFSSLISNIFKFKAVGLYNFLIDIAEYTTAFGVAILDIKGDQ